MNLFLIYAEFFKIGLFSVGGGLATLPFLFRMTDNIFTFISRTDWIDREIAGNFIAIAQSSPGAIGVNVAAQTGFQYAGVGGAFCAALGLISPAIVVITIVARMLRAFKENRIVASVFSGLRPAAGGLLAVAGFSTWKLSLYNPGGVQWYAMLRWKESAIFAALFLVAYKFKGHPVVYIITGALAGIVLGL